MGGRRLHRDDDIDSAANQFRRQFGEASVLALRRSDLELNIFPLDIAKVGQRLAKRPQGLRATDEKEADAPHPLLLCARRERPYRRTTDYRDELAPPHMPPLSKNHR